MWNKKQYFALKKKHDEECKDIPTTPGIYLWTRYDKEINKWYFYIGQAKNLRERHFHYWEVIKGLTYPEKRNEYSLKVHPEWTYQVIENCFQDKLNEREQYWINWYAKLDNYISYNKEWDRDRSSSNKKRIDKIENKLKSTIRHSLTKLNIDVSESQLHIYVKENKDGSLNKVSQEAFNDLLEFIKEMKLVE